VQVDISSAGPVGIRQLASVDVVVIVTMLDDLALLIEAQ
jgi:hypothetical protein